MRLWILRPVEGLPKADSPWEPWYDRTFGFVVRAETESDARAIASEEAGEEGTTVWMEPKYTTCKELLPEGVAGLVMRDFAAA